MTAKTDVDLAPVVQKVDNAIKQWRMLAEALEEAVHQKILKIEVLENQISSIFSRANSVCFNVTFSGFD